MAPRPERRPPGQVLPVFPWDTIAQARTRAAAHPDGLVDLTVGTPVDPVAPVIRDALAADSAFPGYPTTAGTPALRAAIVDSLARRYGVTGLTADAVLPAIGTKELIAALPTHLGLGQGHRVFGESSAESLELDGLFRALWRRETRFTPVWVEEEAPGHAPR